MEAPQVLVQDLVPILTLHLNSRRIPTTHTALTLALVQLEPLGPPVPLDARPVPAQLTAVNVKVVTSTFLAPTVQDARPIAKSAPMLLTAVSATPDTTSTLNRSVINVLITAQVADPIAWPLKPLPVEFQSSVLLATSSTRLKTVNAFLGQSPIT